MRKPIEEKLKENPNTNKKVWSKKIQQKKIYY